MKTRVLHTKFWKDSFVSELDRISRYIFCYLLTNEKINICGIYELTDKEIKFDLDVTQAELDKAKQLLRGKVIFHNGWVRVLNVDRYNSYSGVLNEKARQRELGCVPKDLIDMPRGMDTSIDTSIYTYQKSEIRNKKENKRLLGEKEEGELLAAFNKSLKSKYKSLKPFHPNIEYWLSIYTVEDMVTAIGHIPHDQFWKDKMEPSIFFRQKDRNQSPVDYIGRMLKIRVKEDRVL